eukprot:SAG31_NODE_4327_length_3353_cov_4.742778_2_plen_158_part_00
MHEFEEIWRRAANDIDTPRRNNSHRSVPGPVAKFTLPCVHSQLRSISQNAEFADTRLQSQCCCLTASSKYRIAAPICVTMLATAEPGEHGPSLPMLKFKYARRSMSSVYDLRHRGDCEWGRSTGEASSAATVACSTVGPLLMVARSRCAHAEPSVGR